MLVEMRGREVSFPKIILRPHFKKENLRLFGGWCVGGYASQRQVRKGDELGVEVARGTSCFPARPAGPGRGRAPGRLDGGEGHVLPVGLARTEAKTT